MIATQAILHAKTDLSDLLAQLAKLQPGLCSAVALNHGTGSVFELNFDDFYGLITIPSSGRPGHRELAVVSRAIELQCDRRGWSINVVPVPNTKHYAFKVSGQRCQYAEDRAIALLVAYIQLLQHG